MVWPWHGPDMRVALRWSRRLLVALALLVVVLAGGIVAAFRLTVPPGSNHAPVPGLSAPVSRSLTIAATL